MSDQRATNEQPFFEMGRTDYTHFRVYYTTPDQPTCKGNPDHFPPTEVHPATKKSDRRHKLPTTDCLARVAKKHRLSEAVKVMTQHGIEFSMIDGTNHVIIERNGQPIADHWPTTGTWQYRNQSARGCGLTSLIKTLLQPVSTTGLSPTDSLGKVEKRFRYFEAAKILKSRGIGFTVHDNGIHLIINRGGRKLVDLWPTTGRWIHRLTGEKGRGLDSLVEYISRP